MNIKDNRVVAAKSEPKPLEAGEVLIGIISEDHYIVLADTATALRLPSLTTTNIATLGYVRTGIKKENITITFEGTK